MSESVLNFILKIIDYIIYFMQKHPYYCGVFIYIKNKTGDD